MLSSPRSGPGLLMLSAPPPTGMLSCLNEAGGVCLTHVETLTSSDEGLPALSIADTCWREKLGGETRQGYYRVEYRGGGLEC